MVKDLPLGSERSFRDALRSARAVALSDAEAFDGIVHVIEEIGIQLAREARGLGRYIELLVEYGQRSALAADGRLATVLEHLRIARNDAVHVGAFARSLTQHAIEAALILEDALMSSTSRIADFMVPSPVCAHTWQTVGAVRQIFLSSSFSWLPIRVGEDWRLLSDFALARYLRSSSDNQERRTRLAARLGDVLQELGPLEAPELYATDGALSDAVREVASKPILVVAPDGKTLAGIITAYDCL